MQYSDNEVENANKRFWIITLIIIILILLCLYFIGFGKLSYASPNKISTGNVDVFDIKTECEECSKCLTCECDDSEIPVNYSTNKVIVYDDIDLFVNQVNLSIFDKPAYEYDNKIAPGMNNSYHFVVRNNNDFDVLYNLVMNEDNEYSINMMYRLKKDNNYVIGNKSTWVYADEIKLYNISLDDNSQHDYYLEWYWFDHDNDTFVGKNATFYKLNINIRAKIRTS